jgi:hypothetical protein
MYVKYFTSNTKPLLGNEKKIRRENKVRERVRREKKGRNRVDLRGCLV